MKDVRKYQTDNSKMTLRKFYQKLQKEQRFRTIWNMSSRQTKTKIDYEAFRHQWVIINHLKHYPTPMKTYCSFVYEHKPYGTTLGL